MIAELFLEGIGAAQCDVPVGATVAKDATVVVSLPHGAFLARVARLRENGAPPAGGETSRPPAGWHGYSRKTVREARFERIASDDDLRRESLARGQSRKAIDRLSMRLPRLFPNVRPLTVRYALGLQHALFFFGAEGEVDVRAVADAAQRELQCTVEVERAGLRDHAALLGGVGTCGRTLCCASWLERFQPVTVAMAREQGLNIAPEALSGPCDRLKCCLRFEYDPSRDR
ncbi:MAG: regulatory iron-sulfur-containing complex subunit RicT [Kiritimatiellia bacterium]|jgi:hypothetical protein